MRVIKIILFISIFFSISNAQSGRSGLGFYIKPGINYISKNTFTQNTLQSAAFEVGGGIIILKKLCIEYSVYESKGRDKSDNSKEIFKLNTLRFGFLNVFPIHEKIGIRISTGFSINSFNLGSKDIFGYYTSLGFEREISEIGLNYFFDLQYDLVNYQDDKFSGNLGGLKMFLGLKFIKKSNSNE